MIYPSSNRNSPVESGENVIANHSYLSAIFDVARRSLESLFRRGNESRVTPTVLSETSLNNRKEFPRFNPSLRSQSPLRSESPFKSLGGVQVVPVETPVTDLVPSPLTIEELDELELKMRDLFDTSINLENLESELESAIKRNLNYSGNDFNAFKFKLDGFKKDVESFKELISLHTNGIPSISTRFIDNKELFQFCKKALEFKSKLASFMEEGPNTQLYSTMLMNELVELEDRISSKILNEINKLKVDIDVLKNNQGLSSSDYSANIIRSVYFKRSYSFEINRIKEILRPYSELEYFSAVQKKAGQALLELDRVEGRCNLLSLAVNQSKTSQEDIDDLTLLRARWALQLLGPIKGNIAKLKALHEELIGVDESLKGKMEEFISEFRDLYSCYSATKNTKVDLLNFHERIYFQNWLNKYALTLKTSEQVSRVESCVSSLNTVMESYQLELEEKSKKYKPLLDKFSLEVKERKFIFSLFRDYLICKRKFLIENNKSVVEIDKIIMAGALLEEIGEQRLPALGLMPYSDQLEFYVKSCADKFLTDFQSDF